jgi:6-pyruvoyltetrahydropterin/6-carboxytetrahydropterin synthase
VTEIFKEFTFEAAHRLPHVPAGHQCARLHGHSYRVTIHVRGPIHPHLGWVADFADLTAAFQPVRDQLDHHCLNGVDGLANPTSEHLAAWIWHHLHPHLPGLHQITVRETATSGCTYQGPPRHLDTPLTATHQGEEEPQHAMSAPAIERPRLRASANPSHGGST